MYKASFIDHPTWPSVQKFVDVEVIYITYFKKIDSKTNQTTIVNLTDTVIKYKNDTMVLALEPSASKLIFKVSIQDLNVIIDSKNIFRDAGTYYIYLTAKNMTSKNPNPIPIKIMLNLKTPPITPEQRKQIEINASPIKQFQLENPTIEEIPPPPSLQIASI